MPIYEYACVTCGSFEVFWPMAAAGAPADCPGCGAPVRRLFSSPALRSLSPGLRRALDTQARSADLPDVVAALPRAGRRQPRVTDPRQARLPRP
jgi:putative FmdB family regulatory protein